MSGLWLIAVGFGIGVRDCCLELGVGVFVGVGLLGVVLLPTSYDKGTGHARQIIITSGGCYNW